MLSKSFIEKSRHVEAIEETVRTDVPFIRGATKQGSKVLNALAKKFIKKSTAIGFDWVEEVFEIIAESNPQSLGKSYNYQTCYSSHQPIVYLSLNQIKHSHKGHIHTKAPDFNITNADFERIFGREVTRKMDEATKKMLKKLMDAPGVNPGKSDAIFQDMFFETVIAAGDDAYRAALEAWEKQPQSWKDANPFTGNKTTFFDKDIGWIKRMYENGFKEVTTMGNTQLSKVKNLVLAMQLQDEPLSMREMVKELSATFKRTQPYVFKRIIRTEMVGAADKETYERYKEMGAGYTQISISPDACPICKGYKAYNKGYYILTQAPDIPEDTHPNCRCSFLAAWNLPKGVDKNGTEAAAAAQMSKEDL